MDNLVKDLLEGLTVSVDISTGEHDGDHRLMGVVSEVTDSSFLSEDKEHVVLLVQNPEFNMSDTMFSHGEFLAACRLLLGEYGGPSIGYDAFYKNAPSEPRGAFVVFCQYDAPCSADVLGSGPSPAAAMLEYVRNTADPKKVESPLSLLHSLLTRTRENVDRQRDVITSGAVANAEDVRAQMLEIELVEADLKTFCAACDRLGIKWKAPRVKKPAKKPRSRK